MSERKAPTGFIGNTPNAPGMDYNWQTPPELLWPVRDYFGGRIPFDVATTASNPTDAAGFWTPADDGLKQKWPDQWYCNPPYGKLMQAWLEKAMLSVGTEGIALVSAARWEQGWLQEVLQSVGHVCFVRGRVAFIRPATGDRVGGNTYANMFLGFDIRDERRFVECFGKIGSVHRWKGLAGPPPATARATWKLAASPGLFPVERERERESNPAWPGEVLGTFPGSRRRPRDTGAGLPLG